MIKISALCILIFITLITVESSISVSFLFKRRIGDHDLDLFGNKFNLAIQHPPGTHVNYKVMGKVITLEVTFMNIFDKPVITKEILLENNIVSKVIELLESTKLEKVSVRYYNEFDNLIYFDLNKLSKPNQLDDDWRSNYYQNLIAFSENSKSKSFSDLVKNHLEIYKDVNNKMKADKVFIDNMENFPSMNSGDIFSSLFEKDIGKYYEFWLELVKARYRAKLTTHIPKEVNFNFK
jgi:hypothetical protein